jgi:hypothetical protein
MGKGKGYKELSEGRAATHLVVKQLIVGALKSGRKAGKHWKGLGKQKKASNLGESEQETKRKNKTRTQAKQESRKARKTRTQAKQKNRTQERRKQKGKAEQQKDGKRIVWKAKTKNTKKQRGKMERIGNA